MSSLVNNLHVIVSSRLITFSTTSLVEIEVYRVTTSRLHEYKDLLG